MATFAYYNYQFEKIESQGGGLFTDGETRANPEESFARKQEILNEIIAEDFKNKGQTLCFYDKRRRIIYRHRYLIEPQDEVVVMEIANERLRILETKDWGDKVEYEYPRCLVIIDNRPGIQRILIQKRRKAFTTDKVCELLRKALKQRLHRYSLGIQLFQMHECDAFWKLVNDKQKYPNGFKKVTFYFPYLNLERMRAMHNKYATDVRQSFNGKMEMTITASWGGSLNFDKNDTLQEGLTETLMGDVGGNNIKAFPRDYPNTSVWVGEKSYRTSDIDDRVFTHLEDKTQMFPYEDLDKIKEATKRFIE